MIWIHKTCKKYPKSKKKFQITVAELHAVSRKSLFVVYEGLHFRKNYPHWDPTDVTFTLLICVRGKLSPIYNKDSVIPEWKLS